MLARLLAKCPLVCSLKVEPCLLYLLPIRPRCCLKAFSLQQQSVTRFSACGTSDIEDTRGDTGACGVHSPVPCEEDLTQCAPDLSSCLTMDVVIAVVF